MPISAMVLHPNPYVSSVTDNLPNEQEHLEIVNFALAKCSFTASLTAWHCALSNHIT